MSKIKLDPKLRRQVLNDWLVLFPTLKKETTHQIGRRVGPLVISIWLNKPSYDEIYEPRFSVTSVCNDYEDLGAHLTATPEIRLSALSWREHEKGKYKEVEQSLRENVLLPIEGPISLLMIIEAYEKHILSGDWQYGIWELQDPALIAGWAGKPEIGVAYLDWSIHKYREVYKIMEERLKKAIEEKNKINIEHYQKYLEKNDIDKWYKDMCALVYDQKKLQDYTNQQIEKYKLGKLPYEDLAPD